MSTAPAASNRLKVHTAITAFTDTLVAVERHHGVVHCSSCAHVGVLALALERPGRFWLGLSHPTQRQCALAFSLFPDDLSSTHACLSCTLQGPLAA